MSTVGTAWISKLFTTLPFTPQATCDPSEDLPVFPLRLEEVIAD
jgi:hypothetical protein